LQCKCSVLDHRTGLLSTKFNLFNANFSTTKNATVTRSGKKSMGATLGPQLAAVTWPDRPVFQQFPFSIIDILTSCRTLEICISVNLHFTYVWNSSGIRGGTQNLAQTSKSFDSNKERKKTSQELRMLSTVTLDCQVTKIVMNLGSQL